MFWNPSFYLSFFVLAVPSSLSSPGGASASVASNCSGGSGNPTKVVYFTNRSVTPFMSTIAGKKIGEITLRDFKVGDYLGQVPHAWLQEFKTISNLVLIPDAF